MGARRRCLRLIATLACTGSVACSWTGWQDGNSVFALARWMGKSSKIAGGGRLFCGSQSEDIAVWRKAELCEEDISLKQTISGQEVEAGDAVYGGWHREAFLVGHVGQVQTLVVWDGRLYSGSSDGTIRVWGCESLKCEMVIDAGTEPIMSLAVAKDQSCIVSGSTDGNLKMWSIGGMNHLATLGGPPSKGVRSILVCDPHHVVAACLDGSISVWNLETREREATLQGHERCATSLAKSHLSNVIFSGDVAGNICMWNIGGSWERGPRSLQVIQGPVISLLVVNQRSPERELLVVGTTGVIKIFDARSLEVVKTIVHSSLRDDSDSFGEEGEPGIGAMAVEPHIEEGKGRIADLLKLPAMATETLWQFWAGSDEGAIRSFDLENMELCWTLQH